MWAARGTCRIISVQGLFGAADWAAIDNPAPPWWRPPPIMPKHDQVLTDGQPVVLAI